MWRHIDVRRVRFVQNLVIRRQDCNIHVCPDGKSDVVVPHQDARHNETVPIFVGAAPGDLHFSFNSLFYGEHAAIYKVRPICCTA